MRSKTRESESIVLLGSFVLCFFPDSISIRQFLHERRKYFSSEIQSFKEKFL